MTQSGPSNRYWDKFDAGIYVDGDRYFFHQRINLIQVVGQAHPGPISPDTLQRRQEFLNMTELKYAVVLKFPSGHVFTDGPKDKGWLLLY